MDSKKFLVFDIPFRMYLACYQWNHVLSDKLLLDWEILEKNQEQQLFVSKENWNKIMTNQQQELQKLV